MRLLPELRRSLLLAGISLVELLLVLGVLAIVSSISVVAVTNVSHNAQHRKLESDVKTVNSAIAMYLANGGSIDSSSTPGDVIAKLKTTRSKADKELHAGAPSGRLIDARVAAVPVPEDSWKLRARFNPTNMKFEPFESGAGVEFVLDDTLAEVAAVVETRSHGAVNYAQNSTWVWDHAATTNPNAPKGPSVFATNPNPPDSTPGGPVTPDPEPDPGPGPDPGPPPPPPLPRLPTPVHSLSAGTYPEAAFPLVVSITNVPPAEDGVPFYTVGAGWQPYTGPVSVPMNKTLVSYFSAVDPAVWQNSYQLASAYTTEAPSLSGSATSEFHSPEGGTNLKYTISDDGMRFEHGDPVYMLDGEPVNSGDPNVLSFEGSPFSDVPPGTKFKLGDFYYHNGSTYYDSHATGVKLQISIAIPDRSQTLVFDLNLDLVNTENDPDDAAASADYVKITNLSQNIPLQINGVNYKIVLEFGSTDSFGFSSGNQFHVYEGATGQGELLGTFLPR